MLALSFDVFVMRWILCDECLCDECLCDECLCDEYFAFVTCDICDLRLTSVRDMTKESCHLSMWACYYLSEHAGLKSI